MALRYMAEMRADAVQVRDVKLKLVGFYRKDTGERILAPAGMPHTLNDDAVLDQLFWSVPLFERG